MGRRGLYVVKTILKEAVLTLGDGKPCAMEADSVIEARLTVAVHVIGTTGSNLTRIASTVLPRGDVGTRLYDT